MMAPDLTRTLAVAIASAVVCSTLAVVAHDRYLRNIAPPVRIAVVDVAEVYRNKEAALLRASVQGQATDADRRSLLAAAEAFGRDLTRALQELPRECDCLVITRESLASVEGLLDLTPQLRKKVGL